MTITAARSRPESPRRVVALDGIRGLAISLVLLGHVFTFEGDSHFAHLLMLVTSTGWVGVQLFFVLSGFLLTGILAEERGSAHFFGRFYLRRVLRIFPIYFSFLAVFSMLRSVHPPLGGVCYWTYTVNYRNILPNCAQIFALLPLWSLSVEEQFYLLLPATVALSSPKVLTRVLVLSAVASALFRAVLVLVFDAQTSAYLWTPSNLDGFAVGGLAALAIRTPKGLEGLRRYSPIIFSASLAFFFGLGIGNRGFLPSHRPDTSLVLGGTSAVVFSGGLIGLGVTNTLVAKALSNGVLRVLGKYSYAIYLFHLPILEAVAPIFGHLFGLSRAGTMSAALLSGFATVVLSLLLAMLSWRVVEAPALRLKDRFAPRIAAASVAR